MILRFSDWKNTPPRLIWIPELLCLDFWDWFRIYSFAIRGAIRGVQDANFEPTIYKVRILVLNLAHSMFFIPICNSRKLYRTALLWSTWFGPFFEAAHQLLFSNSNASEILCSSEIIFKFRASLRFQLIYFTPKAPICSLAGLYQSYFRFFFILQIVPRQSEIAV